MKYRFGVCTGCSKADTCTYDPSQDPDSEGYCLQYEPLFRHSDTRYGFTWGPAEVRRCASERKWGVMFDVITDKQRLQIRVTPSGLIRVGEPEKNTQP